MDLAAGGIVRMGGFMIIEGVKSSRLKLKGRDSWLGQHVGDGIAVGRSVLFEGLTWGGK